MGFLLEHCLFDRLSSEIIKQCKSYVCKKDDNINAFFHDDTKDNYADYENELMGFSHCFFTDSDSPEMVCAFSLSNTALRTAPLPKPRRNRFNKTIPNAKRRAQYPAILIGQLCVFDKYAHMGIGKELMDLIKTIAINPDNNCAARYLVVDAVNEPKVISYYQDNGFQFLFSTDEEELECLHELPREGWFKRLACVLAGKEKPEYRCSTRLMYFDLILLNARNSLVG